MSSLKSTIDSLASQFASSIIEALRGASLAEVMDVGSGRASARPPTVSTPAPVRRGPGRPKKVAAAVPAAAPKKRASLRLGRLARRSVADIGKVVDDVVALLQKNPSGLRAEQIRSSLNLHAKELPRPLADGLADGRLTKSGQKRATTYFASGAKKRK